jgi:hypothetical protein
MRAADKLAKQSTAIQAQTAVPIMPPTDVEIPPLTNPSIAAYRPGDGWRLLRCLAGLCMIVAVFLPWCPASANGDPPVSYFQFAWKVVPENLLGRSPSRQHPAVSIGSGLLLVLIGLTGVFVILSAVPDSESASYGTRESPPRLTPAGSAIRTMFGLVWRWPAGVSLVVFGFCWLAGLAQTGAPGVWLYGAGAFFALMTGLIAGQVRPESQPDFKAATPPRPSATLPAGGQSHICPPSSLAVARLPKGLETEKKLAEPPFDLRANVVAALVLLLLIGLGVAGWNYHSTWMKQQDALRGQHRLHPETVEEFRKENSKLLEEWQRLRPGDGQHGGAAR